MTTGLACARHRRLHGTGAGAGAPVDKRADIWAFGCVLYEMLTGRRAFIGDDMSLTLASVLYAEPDWSVLPATAPPAIRRLLRRTLQKMEPAAWRHRRRADGYRRRVRRTSGDVHCCRTYLEKAIDGHYGGSGRNRCDRVDGAGPGRLVASTGVTRSVGDTSA